MRLLALTLISPLAAQTEPAAPAPQSPARAAPVGGDLFPVEPPPATSCLANAILADLSSRADVSEAAMRRVGQPAPVPAGAPR